MKKTLSKKDQASCRGRVRAHGNPNRAKKEKQSHRAENRQGRLRDGVDFLKGKSQVGGGSKKEYASASRTNPVLPPTFKLHGFSTTQKPKNTRTTSNQVNGVEFRTLEQKISSGELECHEVLDFIAVTKNSIRESRAKAGVPFPRKGYKSWK